MLKSIRVNADKYCSNYVGNWMIKTTIQKNMDRQSIQDQPYYHPKAKNLRND